MKFAFFVGSDKTFSHIGAKLLVIFRKATSKSVASC